MNSIRLSVQIFFLFIYQQILSQSGTTLHYDGTDDYVNCGNHTSVQITGTAITLEANVFIDSFEDAVYKGNIINKEDNLETHGYMLRVGGNGAANFAVGVQTSSYETGDCFPACWVEVTTPENTVQTGQTHHLAATYSGQILIIYVDGVQISTESFEYDYNIGNTTQPLRLGNRHGNDRPFSGEIDEVRIWNVVRTAQQISSNKDAELTLPQQGLVAYYEFNQGTANGDNTSETTLEDALDTNDGTLNNFLLSSTSSNWVDFSSLYVQTKPKRRMLSYYSNPVGNRLRIESPYQIQSLTIHDLAGREVLTKSPLKQKLWLNTYSLSSGVYLLKVQTAEGE
jgi:hypothetical protein